MGQKSTNIRLGYLKHVAGVLDEEESARKLAKIAGSKDAELDEVLAVLFGSSDGAGGSRDSAGFSGLRHNHPLWAHPSRPPSVASSWAATWAAPFSDNSSKLDFRLV